MCCRISFVVLLATGIGASAFAAPVQNFALRDHRGKSHELQDYAGTGAVVLMVQGNGCPVVRNALTDLRTVRERYRDQDIAFLMLNANLQDDAESIRAEAVEWGIDLPILVDETQQVGESLALTRTAEVLVIDPASWEIAYRGPINDRLSYERQRRAARNHYLADALDAVLAGARPGIEAKGAIGCLINFPARRDRERRSAQ